MLNSFEFSTCSILKMAFLTKIPASKVFYFCITMQSRNTFVVVWTYDLDKISFGLVNLKVTVYVR